MKKKTKTGLLIGIIILICILIVALVLIFTLGRSDKHEHTLTHVEPIAATCTDDGIVEHWTCSECDKNFADAEASEEITDLVVPALGHNYVDGFCTRCGKELVPTDSGYFTFTALDDGGYAVAWDQTTELPSEVVIPREYNGKPVVHIDEMAFDECTGLKSVIIPSSVASIGRAAFDSCDSLTSVTIPSSVTSIGDYAFYECRSLTGVTIPSSVTSIGASAFSVCTSLTSVAIPSSVTLIGEGIVAACDSLTSLTVAEGNTVYHSADNCIIETASKTLVAGCNVSVIPADGSVTSIGECAFCDCTSLTSVTIPSSVTSIGNHAFFSCYSLTSVIFENTNGWSVGGEPISAEDLSDPVAAVEYLADIYDEGTWTRE